MTHCFNGYVNGILGWDGRVLGAVSEAVARGVVLDVAHGSGSLSFEVAEMGLAQGLRPTISTDLHSMCIHGPVYDLPTTMSKFLALGLSLEDVVRATTIDAAKAIGRDEELGTLRVGMSADVAVFDIRTGRFEFHDSHGRELKGSQMISPVLVVRAGEVVCRAEEAEV